MSDCKCGQWGQQGECVYCGEHYTDRWGVLQAELAALREEKRAAEAEAGRQICLSTELRRMVEHVAYYSLDNMPTDVRAAAQALLKQGGE